MARPYVWWHWMGSNFSKEGITKDLGAMKASGIGGATIFNIASAVQESHKPTLNNPWPDGRTILAQAWCETIVQRYPAYVDPRDQPQMPADTPNLQPINKQLGRRFVVKSFRWLTSREV